MRSLNNCALHSRNAIFPILFLLLATLTGCPYGSSYKLVADTNLSPDPSLFGKWVTFVNTPTGEEMPVNVIISESENQQYKIVFTGYVQKQLAFLGKGDSIITTGYVSTIANKEILNIEYHGRTYLTEVRRNNDRISLFPLAEEFSQKIIRSSDELKLALEIHYKTRLKPSYDYEFSLRDMVRIN